MSITVFPVVEGLPESEFFFAADWKSLAHCLEPLDAAALQQRIVLLSHFSCYTRRQALNDLGEEGVLALESEGELHKGFWHRGNATLWSLEPCWFSAGEGLGSVSALIEYSKAHPEHFADRFQASEAIGVLCEMRSVLMQAQAEHRRFYLKTIA